MQRFCRQDGMDIEGEDSKNHDDSKKGALDTLRDGYRFTPSMMDPNSLAFSTFANQSPSYYTPATLSGANAFYHSQAGDLHTPGMGMSFGTPLSPPQSANTLCTTNMNASLSHHDPELLQAHHFEHTATYQNPQLFASSSFLQHQDSGYEAISPPNHQSPSSRDYGRIISAKSIGQSVDLSTRQGGVNETVSSNSQAMG